MATSPFYRIHVPVGSRLEMLVRRKDHWEVWTSLANKQNKLAHPDDYIGLCLKCYDDGRVVRHHVREDGTEEDQEIKGEDDGSIR